MITFIFPTVERVTSKFRTKERPKHHGVDFAQKGVHFIKAVADGKVTRSDYSKSYGEVVYIEHNIHGEIWECVYAHMQKNSRRVKVGQVIKQGHEIGIMGNTGDSTGQHLHFELHRGKWNMEKSNAVDPLLYLGQNFNPVLDGDVYVVKKGDTLSGIEKQYKTTVKKLLELNKGIKNKNLIHIGQVINLPVIEKTQNYKIKSGDTLSGIARKYNTNIATIMKLNPSIKNPDIIVTGNKIKIPK